MDSNNRAELLKGAQGAIRLGQIENGIEMCQRLIRSNPDDLSATMLLASALGQSGRTDEAIRLLRRALELDPSSIPARAQLASALRAKGDFVGSIEMSRETVRLAPDSPMGYLNLGLAYLALEEFDAAIAQLTLALGKSATIPMAHVALGAALFQLGRLEEAARAYENALSLNPNDFRALRSLATLELELGKQPQAKPRLEKLKFLPATDPLSALNLAKALNECGDPEGAEEVLSGAVEAFPQDLDCLLLLGLRLQETGRFEASQEVFRQALVRRPGLGIAYWGLVQGRRLDDKDAPLVEEMQSLAVHSDAPIEDRKYLHYSLGKAHDDLKQYEQAMNHYDEANALAQQTADPFDADGLQEALADTRQRFPPGFQILWESGANGSDTPIFIVGMMRSGTTLVDQILSSHSKVGGAGELDYWLQRWRRLFHPGLDSRRAGFLTNAYLGQLHRLAPGMPLVTDKKPENFLQLGMLHGLFPNARFVHCRRNPVDTCLSVYMNPFRISPEYAHRREDLVAYYRYYESLMDHWRSVIPSNRFVDVAYQDLVEDREATVRRLIEFLGLDWEDACLSHERNSRPVSTLSLWQARQPVYRTSLARWKNYEPWLGALSELL